MRKNLILLILFIEDDGVQRDDNDKMHEGDWIS